MTEERTLFRSIELAFSASGADVSEISGLIGEPGRIFTFPNRSANHSFFAADVIFRDDGAIVLQETNGSNGASTGMLANGQTLRAKHMAASALQKVLKTPCVALLAHADKTGLLPEFYARQSLFAQELRVAGIGVVMQRTAIDKLGDEDISVVIGPISKVLEHIEVSGSELFYQGRKVAFAANPNILPALERLGLLERTASGYSVDTTIFHEGARGVEIALNKAEQQRLAVGTGLQPLKLAECSSWEGAAQEIRRWHLAGYTPVGKINNGSQGVGIAFFPKSEAEMVETQLREMRATTHAAYGPEADTTALPIRLFEFATSTRYRLESRLHLWDVRIECHIYPGRTDLIPCSMRICPLPFNPREFNRNSVLSNLSGRDYGLRFVRTPFSKHEAGKTEIEWAGITEAKFAEAMAGFANWCDAAMGLAR